MGLDAIELVLTAERHFGVTVPSGVMESAFTVESFAMVMFELRCQAANPMPYETVVEEVRQLVARQCRIPVDQVQLTSRFVQDLGLG